MAAYMVSLERLAQLDVEMLFPGHGTPQGAARRRIRSLLRHRREREERVLHALADGPRSVAELVEVVYADVSRDLWPWAERSLFAHLLKLEAERRAARDGERWRPA
jgi:glyoxylase-like metal-dependent hydrolase (beta-lactamase superfamily II)